MSRGCCQNDGKRRDSNSFMEHNQTVRHRSVSKKHFPCFAQVRTGGEVFDSQDVRRPGNLSKGHKADIRERIEKECSLG